jgi:sterol-4alpha-carboxylate 3-dehydrogenase (decarboxylating)
MSTSTDGDEQFAVLGGEGFVGNALVRALIEQYGTPRVASLGPTQRTHTPGYRFYTTDITSIDSLTLALKQSAATCVFHTVSPQHDASNETYERINVKGTQAVIEACRAVRVKKLVFTSSVTVCWEGTELVNIDERLPVDVPKKNLYVWTKVRHPSPSWQVTNF